MKLKLTRLNSGTDSTIGSLCIDQGLSTTDTYFTCEDEFRAVKVENETRIPSGTYEIKLRNEGGMTKRYANRFPDIHRGMLWLQDVPNFEWVYVHLGNTDEDTAGCILVGYSCSIDAISGGGTIGRSTEAYKDLYKKVVAAMDSGEKVTIEIG